MPTTSSHIVILTEEGGLSGKGHQSRCQALADALIQRGCEVELLVNKYPKKLPLVDLIVIDSYKLSNAQYSHYKQYCRHLAVIDDTQRIRYPADIIINPALGAEQLDYSQQYRVVAGAQYALLKKEFWKLSSKFKKINKNIKNVLITLGASSPPKLYKKIQSSLKESNPTLTVTLADGNHTTTEMIDLMKRADVVVSAGGQTLYELACLGTPTIALQTASNQQFNLQQWQKVGFIDTIILPTDDSFLENIQKQLQKLSFSKRTKKSIIGKKLINGKGALKTAELLTTYLKNQINFKDFVELSEAEHEFILSWRNHPEISRWMVNAHVTKKEHLRFVHKLKTDSSKKYWLAYLNNEPIGVVDLTNITSNSAEIGLYLNPELSGKGFGQRMFKSAIDHITNSYKLKTLRLEVFKSNATAIHIYQKFGFRQIDIKQSQKGIELIMELELNS